MSSLSVCHLGPTGYADGVRLQESLVEARAAGETGDWLLFADHPPVITIGRGATEGSVLASEAQMAERGVEVHETARGGDVTWHGPGQLVGYPIVDLTTRGRDLHVWMRSLEELLIRALARYGIVGVRVEGRTGVWVEGCKIASLGIAVRRWVSYHGFALNVAPDLSFFDLIHPCGLRDIQMVSMESLLAERAPSLERMREDVVAQWQDLMEYDTVAVVSARDAWRSAAVRAA